MKEHCLVSYGYESEIHEFVNYLIPRCVVWMICQILQIIPLFIKLSCLIPIPCSGR